MIISEDVRTLKMLLIEDNPRDVRLIRYVLEDIKEVRIDLEWVDRLSSGLERIAQGGIDVVLLDLSLPDSHWEETFERVRAVAAHLPIVILTGMANPSLPPRMIQSGAQDYLVKGETDSRVFLHAILYAIERHKLQNKVTESGRVIQENLVQMERLVKFDRVINGSRDFNGLLRLAQRTLPKLFHAGGFSVFLYDPERISIRCAVRSGTPAAPDPAEEDESIMWAVVNTRRPIFFATRERPWPGRKYDRNDTGFICVPLLAKGKVLGVINFYRLSLEGISPLNVANIKRLVGHFSLALYNAILLNQIEAMAGQDPLTQLFNRRHLFRELSVEMGRSRELGLPLSILILDIDGFKRVNDSLGHCGGDDLLKSVAGRLRSLMRAGDTAYRFGGDEFLVVLPATDGAGAQAIAETLRKNMGALSVGAPAPAKATVSIGATEYVPGESQESLVKRADAALYAAKRRGRNRCVYIGGAP